MSSRGRTAGRVLVLLVAALGAALAGLSYPIASKGTGWLTATWEHPWLLGALALVPVVLYRTTFGEDARLPRLRLGTILPLTKGPAGQRVWLRDIPGVLRAVALGVAVARLRRSHAASKAIVLLTDGDNNAGQLSPEYATHLASVVGAKTYTVQIGSGELSQALDGFDLFGQPHYVTKSYPTNPELLKKIAQQTGGRTYVATDARALQASLHDVLNQLEKTKVESTVATFQDLYRYLLLPGVLLVGIEAILRSFVLRRFP